MTTYSPYKAAQLVNAQLKAAGYDKILPPQMFYTYTRPEKGYIKATVVDGKRVIKAEDLAAWYESYVNKNLKKAEDQVAEDQES